MRLSRLGALGGLLVLSALGGVEAEGRFGRTLYRLASTEHAVPHRYAFDRNVRLPWLDAIPGLGWDPGESVTLRLPAAEVAEGLPGYALDVSLAPTAAIR